MSSEMAVLDVVIDIVSRSLRQAAGLGPESDVFELGADSMVMMSVIAQLETQFDIEFESEHLVKERLVTPVSIAALLTGHYQVAARAA